MAVEFDELRLIELATAGDKLALGRLLLPCYDSIATHIAASAAAGAQGTVGS
jgi:hypothetical protein